MFVTYAKFMCAFNQQKILDQHCCKTLADLWGRYGCAPPSQSNFFHFHAFFGKKSCKIIGFCHNLRGAAPRLENHGSATVRGKERL